MSGQALAYAAGVFLVSQNTGHAALVQQAVNAQVNLSFK
jgi:hypothetical protein